MSEIEEIDITENAKERIIRILYYDLIDDSKYLNVAIKKSYLSIISVVSSLHYAERNHLFQQLFFFRKSDFYFS